MSTLHERLLAWLGPKSGDDGAGTWGALRAVVELHSTHEGRCTECVEWCECTDASTCEHGNVAEPCHTKRRIARALGVEIEETPK